MHRLVTEGSFGKLLIEQTGTTLARERWLSILCCMDLMVIPEEEHLMGLRRHKQPSS